MPNNSNRHRLLLCQYMAVSDPAFTRQVILKYGYNIPQLRNMSELGSLLDKVVMVEGEPALKDIATHHPDKELIIGGNTPAPKANILGADGSQEEHGHHSEKKGGCGCGGKDKMNFANVNGVMTPNTATTAAVQQLQNNAAVTHHITSTQTNIMLLSAAVIIALAIMSKK